MKPIVLYSSKGGNTEKVAGEIASELNCPCVKITKNSDPSTVNLNDFDLVFIGTGNYVAKPNADMLNFLKEINPESSKQFALFLTWFGRGTSDRDVFDNAKSVVEDKGQKMLETCYTCLGEAHSLGTRLFSRLIGHNAQGHPNAEELSAARQWAKEISLKIA
jgi:flavodoxin